MSGNDVKADRLLELEKGMRVYPTDTSFLTRFYDELAVINKQPIGTIRQIYDVVEKVDARSNNLPVVYIDNDGQLAAKNTAQMLREKGFNCKDKC